MGNGIKSASKSSIQIDFYYRGVRCRERINLKPTPANLKYAERLKGEVLNAIAKDTFDYAVFFPNSKRARILGKLPGHCITVGEMLDKYIKRSRSELEFSTYVDYRNSILRHLIPGVGHLRLTEFTLSHAKDLVASMAGLSRKRIYNVLIPLRSVMADAFADELIDKNPLHGWYPKIRDKLKESDDIDPFTPDEIGLILSVCKGQIRNLFQFAFWTGMRTSELIALEWGDIDWVSGAVRVRRAETKGVVKTTKTRSGLRDIKLLAGAVEALKAQKEHTFLAGKRVFHNPRTGEPWGGDGPIRKTAWAPALIRAKVRYRYPYQTRHTYASTMLSAGENPLWVANQMGHADTTMIFRRYGRWIPSIDLEAGMKASAAWATIGQQRNGND